MQDVVVPGAHQNNHSYVHELSGPTFDSLCKNLAWWVITWRTSKNYKPSKMGYGSLARDYYFHNVCCTNLHKSLSHCLQLLIFPHYQRTPLHIAARENYERTVECLVDKGAGINIKDKVGVSI